MESLSGTSMATPHVSGLLAILTRYRGNKLSRYELSEIFQKSCLDIYDVGKDNISGWGRIDIMKALDVSSTTPPDIVESSMKWPILILLGYIGAYNLYKFVKR